MRLSQRTRAAFALTLLACASGAHAAITGYCDWSPADSACPLIKSEAACTGDCKWSSYGSECEVEPDAFDDKVQYASDSITREFMAQYEKCDENQGKGVKCVADTNCQYDANAGDCYPTAAYKSAMDAKCASASAGERTCVGFVAPATAFIAATALAALA